MKCALAEGQAVKLAVVEDPEGWHVAGLRSRLVRSPDELLQTFEAGCQLRDHGFMDLGNVHDRTAAVFTIRLAQFNPAAAAEDEDTATVCMYDTLLVPCNLHRTGCKMPERHEQLTQPAPCAITSHAVTTWCSQLMPYLVRSLAATIGDAVILASLYMLAAPNSADSSCSSVND